MNKSVKTMIATVVLGVASLGVYATRSFADVNTPDSNQLMPLVQLQKPASNNVVRVRIMPRGHHHLWHLGLNRNKHLTADDARTLTKAALLMQNRHDINLGKLTEKTNKKGTKIYLIQLVNKQDSLVSVVKVNSANGKIRPTHAA